MDKKILKITGILFIITAIIIYNRKDLEKYTLVKSKYNLEQDSEHITFNKFIIIDI